MILLTDEDPCEGCDKKVDDDYGRFCDIACGKYSTYLIKQAAYKAQLKKVYEWGNERCPHHSNGYGSRHSCKKCWQALLEEVK